MNPTEWTYHLQPIVRLRDRTTVGYEVLARFPDQQRPDVVFEAARTEGTLIEFDLAVARGSFKLLDVVPEHLYLSVNVTSETLASQPDPIAAKFELAKRNRIVAEVSELSMAPTNVVYKQLIDLRNLGIRYAVDDVGTAYGNVFRILQFLPDMVKIDQSLIHSLSRYIVNRAVVRGIVGMARELRIDVVAEGIEDEEDLKWCLDLGIIYGQGWLLGRPAPIEHWYPESREEP